MSKQSVNVVGELIDDIHPVFPYVGIWILNAAAAMMAETTFLLRTFRSIKAEHILSAAIDFAVTAVRYQLQFVLTTLALTLNALTSIINNGLSLNSERPLNQQEIDYLRPVFGTGVDYSVVRIQSGGLKESLGISPQVVGNDIFLRQVWWREKQFNDDQTLTLTGLRVLGHEMGHVWQFQTGGAGYIGDALLTQFFGVFMKRFNLNISHGYDVKAALVSGTDFDCCNVEQQGVLAELIALTHRANGSLTLEGLNRVSGYKLTEAQFEMVKRAHQSLQCTDFQTCVRAI